MTTNTHHPHPLAGMGLCSFVLVVAGGGGVNVCVDVLVAVVSMDIDTCHVYRCEYFFLELFC